MADGGEMTLVHGRAISAEEVERIVGRQFPNPALFPSLCNALAWVLAGQHYDAVPSFNERVNVQDQGIDAAWEVDLPREGVKASALLGPGWTVYQYKQRDVSAQDRAKVFAGLKRSLDGALADVHQQSGRLPDRYCLFTNLHLVHKQKEQLRAAIRAGASSSVAVEIVGAAELATFLNAVPAIRSAYFVPSAFATWSEAWRRLTQTKFYGRNLPLHGRATQLTDLRDAIASQEVKAVVLAGPQEIGKSRLALEMTRGRQLETVVALDPRSMSLAGLAALEPPVGEAVVIVEDPEPERAEAMIRETLARERLKLIVTLPTAVAGAVPNFGQDPRIRVSILGTLAEADAAALFRLAAPALDYGVESWVLQQAGGNPGVLLLAAAFAGDLRRNAGRFADQLAAGFEQRVRRSFGDQVIPVLQVLSVLTHTGVRGPVGRELELSCRFFGGGIDVNAVLTALQGLTEAGVVRLNGRYAEVVPPLFANALACAAFQGRLKALGDFFAALDERGRMRLIRRLQRLAGEETGAFWSALFQDGGPLYDLAAALANPRLLRQAAVGAAEDVARVVAQGLERLDRDERHAIAGDSRREIMWALEELLFREPTSLRALRCLALLADAESETWGNNAIGVFREAFSALHPQLPLPLDDRIALLRELLADRQPPSLRLVGIRAIESALGPSGPVTLRRSGGRVPLGTRPPLTHGQIWEYEAALLAILFDALDSANRDVAAAAGSVLPNAVAHCATHGPPAPAVERFGALVEGVNAKTAPVSVAALANALALVRDQLQRWEAEQGEDFRPDLRQALEEVRRLLNTLNEGDFATRLRRWASGWGRDDDDEVEGEGGGRVFRSERELRRLASEVAQDAARLTAADLDWLCSSEAQRRHTFFWWLGREDRKVIWRAAVEERAGRAPDAFAAYFGGAAEADEGSVSQRLDELAASVVVPGDAIVRATGYLRGDAAAVARVVRLLNNGRADGTVAAKILGLRSFTGTLPADECLKLLLAVAGQDLSGAGAVIDFLGMWLHQGRPLEAGLADLAWRCLESGPPVQHTEEYDFDRLAAHLAPTDPDRAFALLERLVTLPYDRDAWDPLQYSGTSRFWSTLLDTDRERSLRLVLSLALKDEMAHLRVTWDLRTLIDQERDAASLIAFAREGEDAAAVVSSTITAGRPGFWPIATAIVDAFPKSDRIEGNLAAAAEHMGLVISGPFSEHHDSCRREVERVLAETTPSVAARRWLEQVAKHLREQAERERLAEADEEVNF